MFYFIIAGICLIWAIVVIFFSGEKYMKWYYRNTGKNYQDFDPKKFKLAHAGAWVLMAGFALLTKFTGENWILIFLCAAPVLVNYLLIITWCKKK